MLSFESDYIIGAHEAVLSALVRTNGEVLSGYGNDIHTKAAKELIKAACGAPKSEVFFLTGGTQANQVVISTMLKPFEGVISAKTGHIALHEVGAIEFTGHKVIELEQSEGKLCARDVRAYLESFWADENNAMMVVPKMIYISHPTEYGTLYSLDELTSLREICDEYGLRLFLDGARLGYGLMSRHTDVSLSDVARLCDVFYIGGTKVGALFGEAVVIRSAALNRDFRYMIKQRGGMLAKGRLLGIQFDTLFTDDLYTKIARNANDMAYQIRDIFVSNGYPLLFDSPTNQQYPIISDEELAILGKNFGYEYWERVDETHSGVRFCGSWATTQEQVDALREAVNALKK